MLFFLVYKGHILTVKIFILKRMTELVVRILNRLFFLFQKEGMDLYVFIFLDCSPFTQIARLLVRSC